MEPLEIVGILAVVYVLFDWYEDLNQRRTKPSIINAKKLWSSSSSEHVISQPIISRSKCIHYMKHRRLT